MGKWRGAVGGIDHVSDSRVIDSVMIFWQAKLGTCIMTYLHYFSLLLSILVYFILLEWAVLYRSLVDPFLLFRWFILCFIRDLINLWNI